MDRLTLVLWICISLILRGQFAMMERHVGNMMWLMKFLLGPNYNSGLVGLPLKKTKPIMESMPSFAACNFFMVAVPLEK